MPGAAQNVPARLAKLAAWFLGGYLILGGVACFTQGGFWAREWWRNGADPASFGHREAPVLALGCFLVASALILLGVGVIRLARSPTGPRSGQGGPAGVDEREDVGHPAEEQG